MLHFFCPIAVKHDMLDECEFVAPVLTGTPSQTPYTGCCCCQTQLPPTLNHVDHHSAGPLALKKYAEIMQNAHSPNMIAETLTCLRVGRNEVFLWHNLRARLLCFSLTSQWMIQVCESYVSSCVACFIFSLDRIFALIGLPFWIVQ